MQQEPSIHRLRSEYFWCKAHCGELEEALSGLQNVHASLAEQRSPDRRLKSEVLLRIGYCQWELNPSVAARKDRNGAYANFLASVQTNINYAPAYTYLGYYYADYKRDPKRARRCFHKAFELSPAEIGAAERLAHEFSRLKDWNVVEAVAQRVIASGRVRPAPGSKRKGLSWPHVALGVVKINRLHYPRSIVEFQSALRISPNHYEAWVGLGESYHHSGRYIAATKAFEHAEALEPNLSPSQLERTWFTKYMLANVKHEFGAYDDAIERYGEVLKLRPDEYGVSIALLQSLTDCAWSSLESGLFGEAAKHARSAVLTGISVAEKHPHIFNLWKSLGDAFSIFSWVKGKSSAAPILEYKALLEKQLTDQTAFDLSEIDDIGYSSISILCKPDATDALSRNQPLYAAILAYKRAVAISSTDKHARAVAWYNLGWAEYRAYLCGEQDLPRGPQKHKGYLKAALRCFKYAIENEAGNSEFWNALGVATASLNPKVAQHSLIRSLNLNERSAQTWTNLATLYMLHNDYELAQESFTRAQSCDPDLPHAWLGLGLLALLTGEKREARGYFKHAFEIGSSSLVFPKQQFAVAEFDHIIDANIHSSSPSAPDAQSLIQPFFALHQLSCLAPQDLPYERLSALFAERLGDYDDAEASLSLVCQSVEAQFESTEALPDLFQFAQAKADAARVLLAELNYDAAAEDAETALTLSAEEGVEAIDPVAWRTMRLSAHVTGGLACYFLKDMDRSIEMFRDALHESNSSPEVVCLLARVLWTKGGDEERRVAREQLSDCVERNPTHVEAVCLMGVIALLDGDEEAIAAVEDDLSELRTSSSVSINDRLKITQLFSVIASLRASRSEDDSLTSTTRESVKTIMLSPSQPHGWIALADSCVQQFPVHMASQTALRNIQPNGDLDASDLARTLSLSGRTDEVVKGVMVAPWVADGWQRLTEFHAQIS